MSGLCDDFLILSIYSDPWRPFPYRVTFSGDGLLLWRGGIWEIGWSLT